MGTTPGWHGITRRGFLTGAGVALTGAAGAYLAAHHFGFIGKKSPLLLDPDASTRRSQLSASTEMPGRYPGRVIEVRHPEAVSADNRINPAVVNRMVDRGMGLFTGHDDRDVRGSWGTFFERGDVVAIKVNPVGKKDGDRNKPWAVGSISSFPLVVKVVNCLIEAGVRARDIIIFERYANEFCAAGYKDLVERELPRGTRWAAGSLGYSGLQLDIRGRDPDSESLAPEVERNVVGYDPDVFAVMGYAAPEHSPRDDRRFRSHLSLVVSRMCNKMITLPVLKDHRSAGVTLALKNMSHGMNNNVARSHLAGIAHGFGPEARVLGPNQCNTFIPQAAGQHRLRQKATLHILDGLIGVYEGGPGMWNRTWGTWRHKGLFFATDPVAMDHVGWDIIDAKRAELGWAPVARMGFLFHSYDKQVASTLAPLAARDPLAGLTLAAATDNMLGGRGSEAFNLRQPDHVMLAGQLGLGVFPRDRITYYREAMS